MFDIVDLEVELYRREVRFVHFAPDEARMEAAWATFWNAAYGTGLHKGPDAARFMTATFSGTNSGHVPVLILEDEAEMDPKVVAEALAIPACLNGNQPMVIRTMGRRLSDGCQAIDSPLASLAPAATGVKHHVANLMVGKVSTFEINRRVQELIENLMSDLPTNDIDRYQELALRTAPKGDMLKLLDVGAYNLWEAGEIGNIVKKVLHHGHKLDDVNKDDKKKRTYRECIVDESGDVLWALSAVLHAIGFKLSAAADGNVAKLKERYPQGFSEEASRNRTV